MDVLDIMQVSAPAVALTYLLQWSGVPPRWAPVLVPLVAALNICVWVYAHGTLSQAEAFSYLNAWIAVSTSCATVWGFTWVARRSTPR